MNLNPNNLENLINSPSFRGGVEEGGKRLIEEVGKQGPRLLDAIVKLIEQLLR